MNYSTQALTKSLQKIASEERKPQISKGLKPKSPKAFSAKALNVSSAADDFLETRRVFQLKASEANFGSY